MNCIASERVRKGMSQRELGEVFGVSGRAVSNWETGKRLSAKKIVELADYFECSTDYLMRRTDERNPYATGINR